MDINFLLSKKRREFGKPCAFMDVGPILILEVDPNLEQKKEFFMVPSIERVVDNSTRMGTHEVNTESHPTESRGMKHMEGGWPASVDNEDEDSMARFRKKVEKDKSYVNTIKSLADFVETFVMENNSIDLYEEYFAGEKIEKESDFSLRNLCVFRDLVGDYRSAVDISWTVDSAKFAAAYTLKQSCECPVDVKLDSYVWDAENSISPVRTLQPEVEICCVECSPADANLLLSGSVSGQVALWDIRLSGRSQHLSDALNSHTERVTGIKWLVGKHEMAFYSTSSDGQMISWDARNLSSTTEILKLTDIPNIDQNYTISCVEYDRSTPYQFMVGTHQGIVLSFNRKYVEKNDMLKAKYDCSGGPIHSVERNAFFPELFATCDTWSIKYWSDASVDYPILNAISTDGYFTDVAWSPTRASSLYAAKTTGILEVWDVPGKSKGPFVKMKLSEECLLKAAVAHSGEHIACGSYPGSILLLKIPDYLRSSSDLEVDFLKSCIKESDTVTGGKRRADRILECEKGELSSGIEDWWDPPEKAEDLAEENDKFLRDFIRENRQASLEAVSNRAVPVVSFDEEDISNTSDDPPQYEYTVTSDDSKSVSDDETETSNDEEFTSSDSRGGDSTNGVGQTSSGIASNENDGNSSDEQD